MTGQGPRGQQDSALESRKIAADALVVQNSQRLVVLRLPIPHQHVGQVVKNEPLAGLIDSNHHMIFTMSKAVHDYEPDVVSRYSKLLSSRILGDRIGFAVATSHRNCLKWGRPIASRWRDYKIDSDVEMTEQRFAVILPNLIELLHERLCGWAIF